MPKLTRKLLKLFGENGLAADFGQFGSLADGTKVTSKDIDTLQANAAWGEGWQDATLANKRPAYQDFNGWQYVHAYELFYLFETGVPEWIATQTYYQYSICQVDGVLYRSLQNTNLNKDPVTETAWWETVVPTVSKTGIQGSFKNLAGAYATTATVTYSADQIVLQDGSGNQKLFTGLSSGETANKGTAGPAANGRDQAGAFSNSSWCYVWAIGKEDGTIDLILSASATAIAGLPSGYTYYALIGCAYIDGSGNFINYKQTGRRITYTNGRTAYSGTPGAGWTSVDISAYVPNALSSKCFGTIQGNTSNMLYMTNDNSVSSTSTTAASNRIVPAAVGSWKASYLWDYTVLTANTLYVGMGGDGFLYIDGFELNKL